MNTRGAFFLTQSISRRMIETDPQGVENYLLDERDQLRGEGRKIHKALGVTDRAPAPATNSFTAVSPTGDLIV